jgi:IS5 family transposase
MKRSNRKALSSNKLGRMQEKLEHLKASVRAKVSHPFHVIKNLFCLRSPARWPIPGQKK